VTAVHAVLGGACVVLFVVAGAWGAWRWYRGEPSGAYWRLLRGAQALLVAEIALGGVMLLAGDRPGDDLHYLYGLLPLVVAFVAEQLRLGSADAVLDARGLENAQAMRRLDSERQASIVNAIVLREMGVTAIGALVCASLAVRAELG
jgi:hypothetical protein